MPNVTMTVRLPVAHLPGYPEGVTRPLYPLTAWVIAVLALFSATGPLAVDMYLPGFPTIAADLNTDNLSVQLTLTTFTLGLAFGQLIIGPLSDTLGRRRLLIACTALSTASYVAAALTPSIELFIAARLLQGIGGAGGIVIARAIIADLADGVQMARMMNVMMAISGIAPVLAPAVGGLIVATAGWRTVFWVLTAVSLVALVGAVVVLKESLRPEDRATGGFSSLIAGGRIVLTSPAYLGYTGTMVLSFGALFAYISGSSFVLQDIYGLSTLGYTLAFSGNALLMVALSSLSAAVAGKVSTTRLLVVGLAALLLGALVLLLLVSLDAAVPLILGALALTVGSLGLVMGNASGLAMGAVPGRAGTASAFMGFFQFALGALVSPVAGLGGSETALPMVLAMVVCGVGAWALFALGRRSGGSNALPTPNPR